VSYTFSSVQLHMGRLDLINLSLDTPKHHKSLSNIECELCNPPLHRTAALVIYNLE